MYFFFSEKLKNITGQNYIHIYILSNKNLLIKKYLNTKQPILKLCITKPNSFSFNICGGC